MANPVKPFGFKLVDERPLLPQPEGIRDGLRQQPDLSEDLIESLADEFKRVHGGVLLPAGARASRR
jgi:hypothetical protein